jgi:hypothetical protein
MANTNPGGVELNTSPYFDDYDEDKKFVRVLYVPGRAIQARELSQAQTLQQVQIKRFAEYFFKQGAIVDGCEQNLDVNLNFAKLQTLYNGSEVDVTDFENKIIYGANTGIKALCGLVSDIEGGDPKTLFVNYLSVGSIVLTVNNATSSLTSGNTLYLSTGNTAIIEATFIDPVAGTNKIIVKNPEGTLTATSANTVNDAGETVIIDIFSVSDKRTSSVFENNETLFTLSKTSRDYAQTTTTRATTHIVNEGLATESISNYGSKITIADGVVWLADHFVKHSRQSIILDKYTNTPSYKVGLVPQKTFVDYIADQSLVDNAQGTPNFQAPGADRFKIDVVLTKIGLEEVTGENEFFTISEIENGLTRKRKLATIENKLEEVIAKRTNEESGNYTVSDPIVTVKEHLDTGTNGGRYTAEEGGNSNLLLLEVDPFTSYVSGYRNQIIVKTPVEISKGLDTQYVEQTKTQINYGQYIEVNELVGGWDFMEATKVDLYDTPQQVITNHTFSSASVTGNKIGEARVRAIEYVSGTPGLSNASYYLYLYEIEMSSGKSFTQVRSIYDSATPKRFADIVLDPLGNATLKETSFNSMIFKLPFDAIKTIRDTQQNIESGFRFKKKFSVTFSAGVATIATTDSSESFIGTGVLSEVQKDNFYMVVVNNGGSDVETSNLTGTVTVGAGSTSVVGSGTSFSTQLNIGDNIKIGSQKVRVASIESNVGLTLENSHTAGASGASFLKVLSTGAPIDLSGLGGSGSTRSVNVSSPGTVVIDLKESATFTADVIVSMDRANAREKRKTLNYRTETNLNPNTHPSGISGPFSLGYGDLYQIHSIHQSADFDTAATTSDTDVTSNYNVDNGQRDYAYEHATIRPKPGVTPTGRLLVVFDHFVHDTSQGLGYASVDSYPVNDSASSNTTINTTDIPVFTSPTTGRSFNLRDCLDFRPIKTAATGLNPVDPGTYQIPSGGIHFPQPTSDFDADLIYYKGRISKVYINNRGVFGINDGTPASAGNQIPITPPTKPDTLELAEIVVPPYPSQPKDVVIRLLKNKRYTMRDIGKMNERLERVEYFTSLSFLEKQAAETTELDSDGLDRFKNGIIVDPFSGHSVAYTVNADFSAAIDKINRFCTTKQDNANTIDFKFQSGSSTTERQDGNKIMLPYTEVEAAGLKQSYASKQLRLAEELNFFWTGDLKVIPHVDNFFDTVNDPEQAITYDDTGDAENWRALVDAWNSEVAPLNVHWVGGSEQTSLVAGTAQTRTEAGGTWGQGQQVTTQLQRTTADAFNQLASGSQSATGKQEVSFERVIRVETALWMREREFIIRANGLKNNSRIYAFFDGINVTENCYQIYLKNNTTIEELNDEFDNAGFLQNQGTNWDIKADGSIDPMYVEDGEIYLLFRVPEKTFYVGQREFKVTDSPTNSEGTTITSARNTIYAQGIKQQTGDFTINSRPYNVSFTGADNIVPLGRRTVNEQRVETSRVSIPPPPRVSTDPLSQSFYVDPDTYPNGFYVTSIDLYFRNKSQEDSRGVRVELREIENGFPSPRYAGVGDEAYLKNSEINTSEDASEPTNFAFKNPVYLKPGSDYAFCMKPDNNDPDFAIWVAELGQIDVTNPDLNIRIESAYNSGLLFSSSNDRTWTARQNTDAKFTMYIAEFNISQSRIAYWTNFDVANNITYDAIHPIIGDQVLPGTVIQYEVKTADSTYAVDEDWTSIKNYERLNFSSRKQVTNSSAETSNGFKSLQLRATLTSINKYITPYVDDENLKFNLSKNIINNDLNTAIDGTVTYTSGTNFVVGTGTDFSNTVFAGEYAFFGDEYRRIQNVSNNTYLTVDTNFTTSNAVSQTMTIRNEENPTGPYSSLSRYITKIITLNDGFEASDLAVYLNVNRPPGTSIKVYAKLLNENDSDAFDDKFYTEMALVGSETFTLNQSDFKEEKYVLPAGVKTGGAELLAGTVTINSASSVVQGSSTRFTEDLKIGDTIAVGVARTERVVSTISNNEFLTVESNFSTTASGEDIYRVLNNEVAYTTPDGRTFQGYKYFSIKVVFLSSNPNYAPKIKDLRGIALA